jgi:hypothetical protein
MVAHSTEDVAVLLHQPRADLGVRAGGDVKPPVSNSGCGFATAVQEIAGCIEDDGVMTLANVGAEVGELGEVRIEPVVAIVSSGSAHHVLPRGLVIVNLINVGVVVNNDVVRLLVELQLLVARQLHMVLRTKAVQVGVGKAQEQLRLTYDEKNEVEDVAVIPLENRGVVDGGKRRRVGGLLHQILEDVEALGDVGVVIGFDGGGDELVKSDCPHCSSVVTNGVRKEGASVVLKGHCGSHFTVVLRRKERFNFLCYFIIFLQSLGWVINYTFWRANKPFKTNPLYIKPANLLRDA